MSIGQAIGLLNLVAGVWVGYRAIQMHKNARTSPPRKGKMGVVIAFKDRSHHMVGQSLEDTVCYCPVIEYQTEDGSKVVFENRTGSRHWNFGIGSEVEIAVDPHNPTNAVLVGTGAQDPGPTALAAISGLMILSAPLAFFFL